MGRAWTLVLFVFALAGDAAEFSAKDNEIPPLRPPLNEMPPGFWEAHGSKVLGGAAGVALLTAGVVIALRRRRPAQAVPPEVAARKALEGIRKTFPVNLSVVSRVTRGCLGEMLDLPAREMTTAEFCALLDEKAAKAAQNGVQSPGSITQLFQALPGFAPRTRDFLERCDRVKFAPGTPDASWDAPAEALELIEAAARQRRMPASHRQNA